MFSIYLITNKENGKVYVGQTCQELKKYLRNDFTRAMLNNGDRKPHLYNALRKYGETPFSIERIAICKNKKVADVVEKFFIKKYNSQDKEIGYNIAEGGGGSYGYTRAPLTPEQIQNYRIASLGKKQTEETKMKKSLALTGRVFSEEHRRKLSEARLGKIVGPFSKEHKNKISEANKGHIVSCDTRKKISEANKLYQSRKRLEKGG